MSAEINGPNYLTTRQILKRSFNEVENRIQVDANASGELASVFGEISSVPSFSPSTICSYTVLPGVNSFLQKVSFGGVNIAMYELLIDGVVQDKIYTSLYFLNGEMVFNNTLNGLALQTGQVVTVRVTHERQSLGTFHARIQTVQVDI